MDYPEARICMVENGVEVEMYDMSIAAENDANCKNDDYCWQSPWRKFVEADLDGAVALIKRMLPGSKNQQAAMDQQSEYDNRQAMNAAKSRFGGRY